ncbi:MAG: hypothetical protein ACNS60_14885 [Candidatus Cyclobacteriaceae bacterium M2_1C_046]
MDKIEIKKKLIEAAIANHVAVVGDFKLRIKELLESEAIINEEDIDLSQSAYNEQAVHEVNLLADQLKLPTEKLELLYALENHTSIIHTEVETGAVVVTDKRTFFVSVSSEPYCIDGVEFIGVSTNCPLYLTMKGLKKGDRFLYNKTHYKIIDVF